MLLLLLFLLHFDDSFEMWIVLDCFALQDQVQVLVHTQMTEVGHRLALKEQGATTAAASTDPLLVLLLTASDSKRRILLCAALLRNHHKLLQYALLLLFSLQLRGFY